MTILTKSVYHDPVDRENDGLRVLIMRKHPMYIKKSTYDRWEKDLAPSENLLDAWFKEHALNWDEFRFYYYDEIANNPKAARPFNELRELDKAGKTITLLCWERNDEYKECHRFLLQSVLLWEKNLVEGIAQAKRDKESKK